MNEIDLLLLFLQNLYNFNLFFKFVYILVPKFSSAIIFFIKNLVMSVKYFYSNKIFQSKTLKNSFKKKKKFFYFCNFCSE